MAKIVLGKTPKNFKPFYVKFTLPDGTEDQIRITFKYRTRSEFAKLLDSMFVAGEEKPLNGEGGIDFVALYARAGSKAVSQLIDIIEEWDFEEPIAADTMAQMHDQFPAAASAISTAYAAACNEGRLGN